jgi:hypothetical protein
MYVFYLFNVSFICATDIPHNRRTPLQGEEALGPISIPRGSRGVDPLLED